MDEQKYLILIEECLKTVVTKFKENSYLFFNEGGLHGYCFSVFYREPAFTAKIQTKDGKYTNVLHPEYPTSNRFDKKKYKILNEKGYSRGCYDLVILKEEFIKNSTIEQLENKNVNLIRLNHENILAAIEFKFIRKNSKPLHNIKWDYCKLKNGSEVSQKYMVVFSDNPKDEKEYFEDMGFNEKFKLVYCKVDYTKNKKQIKIIQKPEGWLT